MAKPKQAVLSPSKMPCQQGNLKPMYSPLVYCIQTSSAPKQVTITVLSAMMAVTRNTMSETRPDFLMARSITTTPTTEAMKQIPA